MKRFLLSLFLLTLVCTFPLFQLNSSKLIVTYPNVNGLGKESFGYAALKLALENSGIEYDLRLSETPANNQRIRTLIREYKVSISDFGTSREFEEELKAIYFPVDLGLNGWRLLLTHQSQSDRITENTRLSDLRKLKGGQGIGWSDIEILENSDLKIITAPDLESLFSMLEYKRYDYLPLGANEAHSLLRSYRKSAPDVVIDEDVVIIYPFARFFFVHKSNQYLHDVVKRGLEKAHKNGSFWALFKNHPANRALFEKANLQQRKQIHIPNPNLTENFKKIPEEYFFSIEMLE